MSKLLDPDEETRAKLLNVVYGHDQQPPFCPDHVDTQTNRRSCATCNTFHKWYRRMRMRFDRQGFRFLKPERPDPKPPACPQGRSFSTHYHECDACVQLKRWDERQYSKGRRRGQLRSVHDLAPLLERLDLLERRGMINADMAAATKGAVSFDAVRELRAGRRTQVFGRTYRALMSIPIPDRPDVMFVPDAAGSLVRSVDGTGTRRRLHAARLNGWPIHVQAARLGWPKGTVRNWAHADSVPLDGADAVAMLYPALMREHGGNTHTASLARTEGRVPGRFFSEANIDDPRYDPFVMVEKPWGLRRRLRGMAWLGHGPEEIAAEIDEPASLIRVWMLGGPAPAYANYVVTPVYERLSFTQGDNTEAADLARHMGWASPLAWDDIDMDKASSQPRVNLPSNGSGRTSHVLTSTVFDALDGKIPAADLLHAEKATVVWTLHRRGWSDRRIGAWLRWSVDLDRARAAVAKFREREGISGFGATTSESAWESKHGLILFGAAA